MKRSPDPFHTLGLLRFATPHAQCGATHAIFTAVPLTDTIIMPLVSPITS